MDPKEFLEYQYGIALTEEKAIIHPAMLVKAMKEYAEYCLKNTPRPHVFVERVNGKIMHAIPCSECDNYFEKKKIIIQGDVDTCDSCLCPE